MIGRQRAMVSRSFQYLKFHALHVDLDQIEPWQRQ
jgi:hypothetical protein